MNRKDVPASDTAEVSMVRFAVSIWIAGVLIDLAALLILAVCWLPKGFSRTELFPWIAGLVLLLCGRAVYRRWRVPGLLVAAVTSLTLLGRYLPLVIEAATEQALPGPPLICSGAGLAASIGCLIGLGPELRRSGGC